VKKPALDHRIAREPGIYYVTPHYVDYDAALARVDLMSE